MVYLLLRTSYSAGMEVSHAWEILRTSSSPKFLPLMFVPLIYTKHLLRSDLGSQSRTLWGKAERSPNHSSAWIQEEMCAQITLGRGAGNSTHESGWGKMVWETNDMGPLPWKWLNSHTQNFIYHLRGSKTLKTQAWIPCEQLLKSSPEKIVTPRVPRLTGAWQFPQEQSFLFHDLTLRMYTPLKMG